MAQALEPIQRVSREHPCAVCGHTRWCGYTSRFRICMWVSSPWQTQNGGWLHPIETPARPVPVPADPVPRVPRARPEHISAVYEALLELLTLSRAHREALRLRGFPPEQAEAWGYRSFPAKGRRGMAEALAKRFGGAEALRGVPGFFQKDGHPSLAGPGGLLVPVLDQEGRIVGLLARRDEVTDGAKYVWLSSAGKIGGTSVEAAVHWARPVRVPPLGSVLERLGRLFGGQEEGLILITEGALKADLAALLSGMVVLGMPGVAGVSRVLEAVQAAGPLGVVVAFDADLKENEHVALARARLLEALAGHPVLVAEWDLEHGKGIDDVLARGKAGHIQLRPV